VAAVRIVIGQIILSRIPSPDHGNGSQVVGFLIHTVIEAEKRPALAGPDNYDPNRTHLGKDIENGPDAGSVAVGRIEIKIRHPSKDAGSHKRSHGNLASIRPAERRQPADIERLVRPTGQSPCKSKESPRGDVQLRVRA